MGRVAKPKVDLVSHVGEKAIDTVTKAYMYGVSTENFEQYLGRQLELQDFLDQWYEDIIKPRVDTVAMEFDMIRASHTIIKLSTYSDGSVIYNYSWVYRGRVTKQINRLHATTFQNVTNGTRAVVFNGQNIIPSEVSYDDIVSLGSKAELLIGKAIANNQFRHISKRDINSILISEIVRQVGIAKGYSATDSYIYLIGLMSESKDYSVYVTGALEAIRASTGTFYISDYDIEVINYSRIIKFPIHLISPVTKSEQRELKNGKHTITTVDIKPLDLFNSSLSTVFNNKLTEFGFDNLWNMFK